MTKEKTKILIVDDSQSVRELLTEFLEARYQVSTAADGTEALNIYLSFHPDIILLDMHMPSMGGLDVIEHLRNEIKDHEVYILVVTGETSFQLKKHSLEQGANDYLIRPYHSEELLARVGVAERQMNLRKQLKAAYVSIEREIEMLGDIQSRLLPSTPLDLPDIDIETMFKPSGRASGDFFDYFTVGDNTVRVAICDVSGHGARAAFLMGVVRTVIRLSQKTHLGLFQLTSILNDSLLDIIGDESDFISLFIVDVDMTNFTMHYVNAGHCPALLAQADNSIDTLEATIPILGVTSLTPEIKTISFARHSSLFLFTDGIYEWRTLAGTYFEQEEFLSLAKDLMPRKSRFLHNLMQALERVNPDITFRDDVTAMYLRFGIKPEQQPALETA